MHSIGYACPCPESRSLRALTSDALSDSATRARVSSTFDATLWPVHAHVSAPPDWRGVQPKPLDAETVSGVQRAFDEAVRDRCRPVPVFGFAHVPCGSGVVLAVNVYPYLGGQPVAVRVRGDEGDGYGDPAWTFPLRYAVAHRRFLFGQYRRRVGKRASSSTAIMSCRRAATEIRR